MIHAASREALAALRERQEAVVGRFSTGDGLTGLAQELYAVAALLEDQPRLRRNLADPATDPDRRGRLVDALLEGKVSASGLQLVKDAVVLRWSSAWDLVDALESVADDVLFVSAEKQDVLDRVEDELFRFERILDGSPQLSTLLDEISAGAERRIELLDSLVSGKLHPVTQQLLEHAVTSQRKRSVVLAIDDLLEAAARRRHRSVARVITAVALTDAQQQRLETTLTAMYGRAIRVRTAVDPAVRGGLVIRVGDELIDGSIATQLATARAALAG